MGTFVLLVLPAAAQTCRDVAHLAADATVYVSPPSLSTGNGWTLAAVKTTLRAGTAVQVCRRTQVGFIVAQQTWAEIRFGAEAGWVDARVLLAGARIRTSTLGAVSDLLLPTAHAEEIDAAAAPPSDVPFLTMVFVAMLLGMTVKGLFDHLDDPGRTTGGYLRSTVKAILVSPIVFLGFAKGADFGIATHLALIVFLCMAFQNGFFWQTILTKAAPAAAPVPGGAAVAVPRT